MPAKLFLSMYDALRPWECVCVLVTQSCLTLCNPMGCSPPGSLVHEILQARILEWVAISFSRPWECSLSNNILFFSWKEFTTFYNFFIFLGDKDIQEHIIINIQFSSVAQLCSTLCNPMNCSTPGFPVHHQLLESTQSHVHWVGDAIQPSHPLSSPSLALNLSQHQGLFQWVSSLHQVAKLLELQLQHQSFQWTPRIDLL